MQSAGWSVVGAAGLSQKLSVLRLLGISQIAAFSPGHASLEQHGWQWFCGCMAKHACSQGCTSQEDQPSGHAEQAPLSFLVCCLRAGPPPHPPHTHTHTGGGRDPGLQRWAEARLFSFPLIRWAPRAPTSRSQQWMATMFGSAAHNTFLPRLPPRAVPSWQLRLRCSLGSMCG
jgi:hypothetical protein